MHVCVLARTYPKTNIPISNILDENLDYLLENYYYYFMKNCSRLFSSLQSPVLQSPVSITHIDADQVEPLF